MSGLEGAAITALKGIITKEVGMQATEKLKKPFVEKKLKGSIAKAAKYAEERWLREYDDRDVVAVITQFPLHDLPSVRKALRQMYEHPDDPVTTQVFRGQLEDVFPKDFDTERIEQAIAAYMEILRSELLNIQELREKLNVLANIKTTQNTHEIKQLLQELLPKEPELPTLYDLLPEDQEGEAEFIRIVKLLLFHEARRAGKRAKFPISRGDYAYNVFDREFQVIGATVYQYEFCLSPLNKKSRQKIIKTLQEAVESQEDSDKIEKWVLITPEQEDDDIEWFRGVKKQLELGFELEYWGPPKLLSLFKQTPALCLFYYPDLIDNGVVRRNTIQDITERYKENLITLYRNIEFVGMSVYKPEATKGVPMEYIYIPLTVVRAESDEQDSSVRRTNPIEFLTPGTCHVILGDPGTGKSTLLRFLALSGISEPLQQRYHAKPHNRLPILVILRRYADELKSQKNLSLLDYIQETIQADFSLKSADFEFFEYYLETGQAILLFDGLDELASPYKETVRDRICSLITTYPGNTTIVSSRIVGYDHPFRFDEKEFAHYRVAKLQLPEMNQFVNDWYAVRIEHKREREANVQDLIRILRSEDHKAIRELAENPLLLTIIALVHRIDAVLPDERVVLYQKCTETLLNTWHTWKFRETEIKSRGKIERRNRRRMEVIANWMHQRMSGDETKKRSVVPYADLKRFLTEHIAQVEKLHDPERDPEDIAYEFLEFVKKRAGLLIEVGNQQYSFVHLTFQEYLTALHIITHSEPGGVEQIWNEIEGCCDDDRWNEVIRLLIAGLRSDDTQEWLIEKILAGSGDGWQIHRALLLGGLLLDSVEAAELRQEEIIKYLLRSGSLATDIEQVRRIGLMLRTWQGKESKHEEVMGRVFQSLWKGMHDEREKQALILMAYILNWSEAKITEFTSEDISLKAQDIDLMRLFFSETSTLEVESLLPQINRFWAVQDVLFLTSRSYNLFVPVRTLNSYSNFVATVGQAVTAFFKSLFCRRRCFEEQLIVLAPGVDSTPYFYFFNSISIISDNRRVISEWLGLEQVPALPQPSRGIGYLGRDRVRVLDRALDRALDRTRGLFLNRDRYLDRAWARARDRYLDQFLGRDLDRPLDQFLGRGRDRDRYLDQILDRDRNWIPDRDRDRDRALDRARGNISEFWQTVLVTPELYNGIINLLTNMFDLKPQSQWREALRIAFLPKVPQRLSLLFDQESWKQTEHAFTENGRSDESEIYSAAWQLLFDAWLYIFGFYQSTEESIFANVVRFTRNIDAPPLRIAHCIRDLAYGDESRIDDLVAMVQSEDPEYRSIFEKCLWRPTPEEAKKKAEEDKRKAEEAKKKEQTSTKSRKTKKKK